MERQVKSRQRVDDHGEVFTARREVVAMCDLVNDETRRTEALFWEPACGEGNFLLELLERKLRALPSPTAPGEWEAASLRALASLYGVDLLPDNCQVCRRRLYDLWANVRDRVYPQCPETVSAGARRILSANILCGDALTGQAAGGPLLFRRWIISPQGIAAPGEALPPQEMAFDVIISNPPYQRKVNESGKGLGAVPLYQKFVALALDCQPRYVVMILPSRWFSGGVGLEDFRRRMLRCGHLRTMVDYTDAKDCFPGVDINGGICYFLWQADYRGPCTFTNISGKTVSTACRDLTEFPLLFRRNEALPILRKVTAGGGKMLSAPGGCSPQTPYGLLSTYGGYPEKQHPDDCRMLRSRGWVYVPRADIPRSRETVDLYKPTISKLTCEHAGTPDKAGQYRVLSRTALLEPGEICSQSYLTVCPCQTREEAENVLAYLRTKFARFLLLQTLSGMNISIRNFSYVPWPDFSRRWADPDLYALYDLTAEEIGYIEHLIREM